MISEKEKSIYNAFLIANRKSKNKPFKLRKNFSNLDPEITVYIKRLKMLFERNSSIDLDTYFQAPYVIYGKDEYFDLKFYTTRRALKCYTSFVREREKQDPDSAEMVDRCKACCAFVYNYCLTNNITLDEYKASTNNNIPLALQHLKEHKINFYTLHGLECEKKIKEIGIDLLDFFVSDFIITMNETRINFMKSQRLKDVVRKSLAIINKQLNKQKQ